MSNISLEKLESIIKDRFALNEIYKLEPFVRGSSGFNYLVEGNDADGKFKWLLKQHRCEKTIEKLKFEESVLVRLKEENFSLIPEAVSDKNGRKYFSHAGFNYSLYKFIEGQCWGDWSQSNLNDEQAYNAGIALAEFHEFNRRIMEKNSLPNLSSCSQSVLPEIYQYFVSVYETKCDLPLPKENLFLYLEKLLDKIKTFETKPTIVHGDYHAGNLLFSGNKLLSIIDFDYLHVESPAYDVGYALTALSSNEEKADFIQGYKDKVSYRLSNEEINCFSQLAYYLIFVWLLENKDDMALYLSVYSQKLSRMIDV